MYWSIRNPFHCLMFDALQRLGFRFLDAWLLFIGPSLNLRTQGLCGFSSLGLGGWFPYAHE